MISARDTIRVDADVATVFEFMDDPHNHAAVTPRLTGVRDVERLENGGKRLSFTYRMAGVGIDGELVQTVHEPNERMRFEMRGRLEGTIDLAFEAAGDGTDLTYAAEYDLPDGVFTSLGEPVVRRFNERQLRATLENVAERFAPGMD
ncbi:carbon monoxide dehydrogenase subunit G [Halorubrum alkaliphilum]|uniref:Carbon monoxide dehydrogenase subunit G n=1 Tax=Halorubrum alkaliphilum TaxID=261290 RepID=A0A8T4GH54_9EURY|nr:SRPBCC family protein [Halorubrum alkaliphilum]MBP1923894.1 carbon monoxide dehydrogenase subunit G [Halorubrum alkaliphilum]